MPKYFEELGLVFFFHSREFSGNELEPVHVHVSESSQSDINDKFWVNFDGRVIHDTKHGVYLNSKNLNKAIKLIKINYEYIIEKWRSYFGEITFNDKEFKN